MLSKYFQRCFPDLTSRMKAAVRFHFLAILLYLNKFLPLGKIQVHLDGNGVVRFRLRFRKRGVA